MRRPGGRWPFVAAGLLLGFGSARGQEPDPPGAVSPVDLMRRVETQDTASDEQVRFTMRLVEASGKIRERTGTVYERQVKAGAPDEMRLIRYESPADIQGSGVLTIENPDRDNDQWLYLPAYHTTRRIAPANRGDRYMGTDFLYEDIMRERIEEYSYRPAGEETIGGVTCAKIESTPSAARLVRESAYSKKLVWVDPARDVILRVDYFNREGRLFKRLTVGAVEKVGDKYRWQSVRMEELDHGHQTTIEYRDRRIGAGVPASTFTETYLKRGR